MAKYKRFVITDRVLAHLRCCAAQGLSFNDAATEVGCVQGTLRNAAQRQGIYDQVRCLFHKHEGEDGIRRLKPEHVAGLQLNVDRDKPEISWLTKPWRTNHA